MLTYASLEARAEELFEQEWHRLTDAPLPAGARPSRWLLSELVRLLQQTHDRPVHSLEPAVRNLVCKYHFTEASESGWAVASRPTRQLDPCVIALMRTLARLRRRALSEGEWSELPVTPQMFG